MYPDEKFYEKFPRINSDCFSHKYIYLFKYLLI